MSPFSGTTFKVALFVTGFTLGVLVCALCFYPRSNDNPPSIVNGPKAPSLQLKTSPTREKVGFEVAEQNIPFNSNENDTQRKLSVDASVASTFWSPPAFDLASGEFQLDSFLAYGLSVENAQQINKIINDSLAELNALEAKNSALKTEVNGDQYFLINPFPSEGARIKEKLRHDVLLSFKDFSDDRGVLLADALAKHQFFAGFGENKIELSVQASANGGPDTINVKTFVNSKNASISRQWLPGTNYVTKRFQALIDKNVRTQ